LGRDLKVFRVGITAGEVGVHVELGVNNLKRLSSDLGNQPSNGEVKQRESHGNFSCESPLRVKGTKKPPGPNP
jgi:hypothetical protein